MRKRAPATACAALPRKVVDDMTQNTTTMDAALENQSAPSETGNWSAVFAMSLCIFALIASEFMPVSLLTPIASDLRISEGQAGQAISISGAFAVVTSLLISTLAGNIDRRYVLLVLTGLMMVSGVVVSVAHNYPTLMIGRALIGVVIGGFWSMSAAVAMRLVPSAQVARALSIFNGGNALATIIAAPLGSFLGGLIGWHGAFFLIVPVAALVLFWQALSLPAMKVKRAPSTTAVLKLLMRPAVLIGMIAVGLMFMGQFALFTYLRPFLESVTRVDVSTLSLLLLAIGVAGFAGTTFVGWPLQRSLKLTLIAVPALMSAIALALLLFGHALTATTALLVIWGLVSMAAPVGWWTWLARALPDEAESGGGLMVAIIQLAITLGAVLGGLLFDASGYQATFALSAFLLLAAAFAASRITTRAQVS